MRTVATRSAGYIEQRAQHYKFEPPLNDDEQVVLTSFLIKLGHKVLSVTDNTDVSTLYLIQSAPDGTSPYHAIERMFDPFDDGLIKWKRYG